MIGKHFLCLYNTMDLHRSFHRLEKSRALTGSLCCLSARHGGGPRALDEKNATGGRIGKAQNVVEWENMENGFEWENEVSK